MTIYQLNPCEDPRWRRLLDRHPRASVFHTPEWLEALRRTYGYDAVALTTSRPGEELRNGVVFCQVRSWLTGRRLVSLPFSDHCDPLVDGDEEFVAMLAAVRGEAEALGARYLEIRPLARPVGRPPALERAASFCLHLLDLRPALDRIFGACHNDCVRRKVRRAETAGLLCEEGRSDSLLRSFYRLVVSTRRRQNLVPQPFAWFRNVTASMQGMAKLRVVSTGGRAIAGVLTLRHKDTLVYKYGCSDARFHRLGGMQMLLWRAIQEAKNEGASLLDLGRSDWDGQGLLAFKDRWGARRSELVYWRLAGSGKPPAWTPASSRNGWTRPRLLPLLPGPLLRAAGSLIYKHLG